MLKMVEHEDNKAGVGAPGDWEDTTSALERLPGYHFKRDVSIFLKPLLFGAFSQFLLSLILTGPVENWLSLE